MDGVNVELERKKGAGDISMSRSDKFLGQLRKVDETKEKAFVGGVGNDRL